MYILKLRGHRRRFPELIQLILSTFCAFLFLYLTILAINYAEKTFLYEGTIIFRYEDKYIEKDDKEIKKDNLLISFDDLEKARIIEYDSSEIKIDGKRVTIPLSREYVGEADLQGILGPISGILTLVSIVCFFIYLVRNIGHIFRDYKWVNTKLLKFRKTIDPLGEEIWDEDY